MSARAELPFIFLALTLLSAGECSVRWYSFPQGGHLVVPCQPPENYALPFGVLRSGENVIVTALEDKKALELPCGRNTTAVVRKKECDRSFCSDRGECVVANKDLPTRRFTCQCDNPYRGRFCEDKYHGRWYLTGAIWLIVIGESSILVFALVRHSRQSQFRSSVEHMRFVDVINEQGPTQ
uniref:EGF-like domain-containing protein n=1 Tax=Steinernema glaseri TaxID=37863 RepID=A0A1I7ZLC8_9BILA